MNGTAYIASSAGWFLAGGGAGYILHDTLRRLRGRQIPVKDTRHENREGSVPRDPRPPR